jgi:hypothetical protein
MGQVSTHRIQRLLQIRGQLLALLLRLLHLVFDKRDPVYGCLALRVAGGLGASLAINAPQLGHLVAVFAEAVEEVELLGKDFL